MSTSISSDLQRFYDERYEGEYMSSHRDVEMWRVRETLASIPKASAILDYGCGRGAWVEVLREVFPDARVTGVDVSAKAVELARTLHPDCRFEAFDGKRAPIGDESFDLVFSYHVLEHVLDLRETVADMARVTKSRGHLCAILPCGNPRSIGELTTRLVREGVEPSETGERRFYYEDPGHLRRPTSPELSTVFAEHGCELVGERYARNLSVLGYFTARPGLVRSVFDPSRARDRRAMGLLAALRAAFLGTSVLVRAQQPGRAALGRELRERSRMPKPVASGVALAAQPLVLPIGHLVNHALPRWEWQHASTRPLGAAAQFLVFRKS